MVKSLKVALVSETYFPQINGVSRTLERLVEHLRAEGHRVHLFIPDYGDGCPEQRDGLEVSAFKSWRLPNYPEIHLPVVRPATLCRHLQRVAPDLMHVATEGPLGWAALHAARRLKIPVVSSYHTNFAQYLDSYRLKAAEGVAWRYLRWFHNRTGATFCPTPSIRKMLEDRGFSTVRVWSRGVDSQAFHPDGRCPGMRKSWGFTDDEVVFLYCGRLAVEKNLALLMEAFALLESPRARLLIIGDGPLMAPLKAGGDPRVVFTGYRQGEELARLYACADVMAFPSLSETFGNVILEAMASGLPVIGFDVPGPKDIIQNGLTGELLPDVSSRALRDSMCRLLEDVDYLRKLGKNARIYAERQNWSRINGVISDGYARCLLSQGLDGAGVIRPASV